MNFVFYLIAVRIFHRKENALLSHITYIRNPNIVKFNQLMNVINIAE